MSGAPKYQGRRVEIKGQGMPEVEVLRPNGEVLDPKPSQKIWNHSPTGFEWGYGGSGPAQLALALLLDYVCDETLPMDEDLRDAIRKEAAVLDEEDEVGIHRFVVCYYAGLQAPVRGRVGRRVGADRRRDREFPAGEALPPGPGVAAPRAAGCAVGLKATGAPLSGMRPIRCFGSCSSNSEQRPGPFI